MLAALSLFQQCSCSNSSQFSVSSLKHVQSLGVGEGYQRWTLQRIRPGAADHLSPTPVRLRYRVSQHWHVCLTLTNTI